LYADYRQDLSVTHLEILKYLIIIKIISSDFIFIFIDIFVNVKLYLFIKNKAKIQKMLSQIQSDSIF
jgi:hypothetical protein